MAKGSRPILIWKGPKTYTRWDGKTGWYWMCFVCATESSDPSKSLPRCYKNAVEHLRDVHVASFTSMEEARLLYGLTKNGSAEKLI